MFPKNGSKDSCLLQVGARRGGGLWARRRCSPLQTVRARPTCRSDRGSWGKTPCWPLNAFGPIFSFLQFHFNRFATGNWGCKERAHGFGELARQVVPTKGPGRGALCSDPRARLRARSAPLPALTWPSRPRDVTASGRDRRRGRGLQGARASGRGGASDRGGTGVGGGAYRKLGPTSVAGPPHLRPAQGWGLPV